MSDAPADSRARLIEVAKKLFAAHGYQGVSVRDIATEAELNISMVSCYFGGKDGLLEVLGQIKTKSKPYGHLVCTLSQTRCQATLAPPATAAKLSAPTSSFPPNRLALVAGRLP